MSLTRSAFLALNRLGYAGLLRPLIFRRTAQQAHHDTLALLRRADALAAALDPLFGAAHGLAFRRGTFHAGGVALDSPLILAAGLVKGDGFESEEAALAAAQSGADIMPGWRSMPRLAGPVEFGSFTRWPRPGNPGTAVWRDVPTRSTQNRIGLRNPGARAAAVFLGARRDHLPPVFGINIAVSPGVDDPDQQTREVLDGLAAFFASEVQPAWFTLNLSCPNTEDDPRGHQTADEARQVCGAAARALAAAGVPLWVKVGPNLSDDQYRGLMRVFAEVGVRAVVATNALPAPTPDDPALVAGMAGGQLHARALAVVGLLAAERAAHDYPVDVVGCGGVQDGETYRAFARLGAPVVQYWTALVYRGPLAAALIAHEAGIGGSGE